MLEHFGFHVEPFGQNAFQVRAMPALFASSDPAAALRALVEDFEEDEAPLQNEIEAKIAGRVCKRLAVKAGQVLIARRTARPAERPGNLRLAAHLSARPADDDPSVGGYAGTAVWEERSTIVSKPPGSKTGSFPFPI